MPPLLFFNEDGLGRKNKKLTDADMKQRNLLCYSLILENAEVHKLTSLFFSSKLKLNLVG